jgi:hypothetical protein
LTAIVTTTTIVKGMESTSRAAAFPRLTGGESDAGVGEPGVV